MFTGTIQALNFRRPRIVGDPCPFNLSRIINSAQKATYGAFPKSNMLRCSGRTTKTDTSGACKIRTKGHSQGCLRVAGTPLSKILRQWSRTVSPPLRAALDRGSRHFNRSRRFLMLVRAFIPGASTTCIVEANA